MKQLFLLPAVAICLLTSCKREQAVWESDWQVPLINDTLTLNQLVEDSILTINSGYYELALNRTIYELKLSDVVDIPDTTVKHTYAIAINSFSVPPGTSFVNNVQEHVIEMGDVQLKKIRVKKGGISISVKSPIGTKTFLTIQLPGVTKNGTLLSQNFVAPAGSNSNPGAVSGYVDLAGYEMDLRGATYGSFNRIQSKLLVTSDPEGASVVVTNQDSIRFEFTMEDVEIDYARGYFGNELITDTLTEYVDALAKIGSGLIDLPEATVDLEIVNGLKVNGKVMLTQLRNTNAQGDVVDLNHSSLNSWLTVNSATGNESSLTESTTSLHFDASNSNLETFLENHGARNDIGFQLQLNPWGNISGGWDEIFPQSALKVNLNANMPLQIGLSDLILQDTFDFSLKQDFTKSHIRSGVIWLKATNAFPLSGVVTLYLMDASGNVVGTINSSQEVKSSVYGSEVNGLMQAQSYVEFVVPENFMDALETVKQLSVKVRLNTPDVSSNLSEQVSVPAGAFFGFKVGAKLQVEARL